MSSTPRTPLPRLLLLPYRQEDNFVFSADDLRVADCECDGQDVPEGYTEQIAAFIARACNSHYELLEALESVIEDTQLGRRLTNGKLWQALAAIAKAREGL